jgi:hypothetical protein
MQQAILVGKLRKTDSEPMVSKKWQCRHFFQAIY